MIKSLISIFSALRKGTALKNKETWKQVQLSTSILVGIFISLTALFPDFIVSQEQINSMMLAVATIGGILANETMPNPAEVKDIFDGIAAFVIVVLLPYWTIATTDTVGLPASTKATDEPGGTNITSPLDGQVH